MAATGNEAIAAGAAAAMALAGASNAATEGAGPALARKLVGDPSRYAALSRGRSRGATQVLDLEPLRKALGASWAAYGELIHGIALRMLHRHLGGAYEHERFAERYVVFFTNMSEREAQERMTRIASALAEFLFGSGTNLVEPARRRFGRGSRSGRGVFAGLGAAIGEAISRLLHTVGTLITAQDPIETADQARNVASRGGSLDIPAAGKATPAADLPAAGAGQTRAAKPAAHAGETPDAKGPPPVEPNWSASARSSQPARRGVFNAAAPTSKSPLGNGAAKAPTAEEPAASAGTAEDAAFEALAKRAAPNNAGRESGGDNPLAKAVADALASAASAQVAKPAKPSEIAVDKLSFVYRPMWSVRTNMLAISGCYPAGKLPNGELGIGEAVLPPAATLEVIEKVDRAALDHVIAHCLPTMETGRGTIIALPVHYETLYDRDRRANYLNVCRRLSVAARKRLIFECRNIDDTSDQGALIATLQQLKPFSTMLIGLLPLRTSNFALWKRAGLGSVGVDIAAERGNESETIEGMHQFALQASQHGLRPTACNLGTLSLAAAATQAGFDFIQGGIIQNQLRPTDVRPFTLEDLYLQYAVARRAKVGPGRLLDASAGGTSAV